MARLGPEILSIERAKLVDRMAVGSGIAIETLMENAGRTAANEIAKRWPRGRVFVICGPGNNSGDGYVTARHLRARGYEVQVKSTVDTASLKDAAGWAFRQWAGPVEPFRNTGAVRPGLYVDAVYGAGLTRAIDPDLAEYWFLVREAECPIVALDVPSGLHGDTAKFLGGHTWQADLTVTFFRKKAAHILQPGRQYCGEIVVTDIGVPFGLLEAMREVATEGGQGKEHFALESTDPPPPLKIARDGHKYLRGHCLVVAGGPLSTGAARLSASAALRSGAGLVTLAAEPAAASVIANHVTAEMVLSFTNGPDLVGILRDERKNVVVYGPGAGRMTDTQDRTAAILESRAHAVLDADALSAFEDGPERLFALLRRRANADAVLTPHEGEFERLFPGLRGRAVNKIEAARIAAEQAKAVIVLKGADTVIAHPDGRAQVNTNAPPWLATAGSGDVLAGVIGALLAQGRPAFEAAWSGVWIHGAAARTLGPGLTAADLPEAIPSILRTLEGHKGHP